MKLPAVAVVLAGALVCGSCASVSADNAVALFRAAPSDGVAGDTQSADPGAIIFTQQINPIGAARADADGSASIPANSLFPTTVSVHRGDELFRVVLRGARSAAAYCSPAIFSSPPAWDFVRSCFSDDEKDGRFDRGWMMVVDNRHVGISGGPLISAPTAIVSIPYTVIDTSNLPPQSLGLKYGGNVFYVVIREGDRYVDAGARRFGVPHGPYPQTVDILGARIEIVSRAHEHMQYRVVSQFPAGLPIESM